MVVPRGRSGSPPFAPPLPLFPSLAPRSTWFPSSAPSHDDRSPASPAQRLESSHWTEGKTVPKTQEARGRSREREEREREREREREGLWELGKDGGRCEAAEGDRRGLGGPRARKGADRGGVGGRPGGRGGPGLREELVVQGTYRRGPTEAGRGDGSNEVVVAGAVPIPPDLSLPATAEPTVPPPSVASPKPDLALASGLFFRPPPPRPQTKRNGTKPIRNETCVGQEREAHPHRGAELHRD